MSATNEAKIKYEGAEGQIDPTSPNPSIPAPKSSDPLPDETNDQRFIRLFRGAFYGPNAMRRHAGRKAKRK